MSDYDSIETWLCNYYEKYHQRRHGDVVTWLECDAWECRKNVRAHWPNGVPASVREKVEAAS